MLVWVVVCYQQQQQAAATLSGTMAYKDAESAEQAAHDLAAEYQAQFEADGSKLVTVEAQQVNDLLIVDVKNGEERPKVQPSVRIQVLEVDVQNKGKATASTATAKATDSAKTKAKTDKEHGNGSAPAKKPTAKSASSKKDTEPHLVDGGLDGALQGLKLLFTGVFNDMDRNTCEATARHYGAQIVSKLDKTDYIVLGVKAGQKKLDEIEEKGLATIDEDGFYDLITQGVPEAKRLQMAADEDEHVQKKRKQ